MATSWADLARRFLTAGAIQGHADPRLILERARDELAGSGTWWRSGLNARIRMFLTACLQADRLVFREGPGLVEALRRSGRAEEADTIALLHNEWLIQRAENYLALPVAVQEQALGVGIASCRSCAKIAERLGDQACSAAYLARLGNGLYTIGRFGEALDALESAVAKWRSLAARQPDQFLPALARSLVPLGNALESCRELRRASEAFAEAVASFRSVSGPGAENVRIDLALALNDLALLNMAAAQTSLAREQLSESLAIFRRLEDACREPSLLLARAKVLSNFILALTDDDGDEWETSLRVDILGDVQEIQSCLWSSGGETPSLGNVRARVLMNVAFVLGRLKRPDSATALLENACGIAECFGWWDLLAELLQVRAGVEQWAAGDLLEGCGHAERAVRTLEEGLGRASDFEPAGAGWFRRRAVDRGRFKAALEIAYAHCLLHSARHQQHDRVFHLLEALREPTMLSDPSLDQSVETRGVTLAVARSFIAERKSCYLAIQVVPKGAVFFAILPSGEVEISHLPAGWRAELIELFDRIGEMNKQVEFAPLEPEGSASEAFCQWQPLLEELGSKLFAALPEPVQRLFTMETADIFLSAYGDLQNAPFEFLHLPTGEWAGLKYVLPRVHSFRQLQAVLERQPDRGRRRAMVVADAGGDLRHARATATEVAAALTSRSFRLGPREEVLTGLRATKEEFLTGLQSGISLGYYSGHGGYDIYDGAFLALARGNLRAEHLGSCLLEHRPILYFDCCQAGITEYRGGGRNVGLGTASLMAGASCCLVAPRPIFDVSAGDLARYFVDELVAHGRTAGSALLAARRHVAAKYESPLCWAFPMLVGNPHARISDPAENAEGEASWKSRS